MSTKVEIRITNWLYFNTKSIWDASEEFLKEFQLKKNKQTNKNKNNNKKQNKTQKRRWFIVHYAFPDFVIYPASAHFTNVHWPLWPKDYYTKLNIIESPLQTISGRGILINPH